MKYRVCTRSYCGTPIMLEEFSAQEEAERFMNSPYTMFYADEFEYADEDEVVYPSDMYLESFNENEEDEIPFCESYVHWTDEEMEMLPF